MSFSNDGDWEKAAHQRDLFFRGLAFCEQKIQPRRGRCGVLKNSTVICTFMRKNGNPCDVPEKSEWGKFVHYIHVSLTDEERARYGDWSITPNKGSLAINFEPTDTEWYRAKVKAERIEKEAAAKLDPPGHCKPGNYDELLGKKEKTVLALFEECKRKFRGGLMPQPEIFTSAPIHFRNRAGTVGCLWFYLLSGDFYLCPNPFYLCPKLFQSSGCGKKVEPKTADSTWPCSAGASLCPLNRSTWAMVP